MSLPPLDKRSLVVLEQELLNLANVYKNCAEALERNHGESAAKALNEINEARASIRAEIAARAAS